MNNYTAPEGMKLHSESCFVNWFRLIDGEFPTYDCSPIFVEESYSKTIPTMVIPPETIEFFFMNIVALLIMSVFGIILVEFMDKKFGRMIDPLVRRVQKRYDMVQIRNRLSTMQGHP